MSPLGLEVLFGEIGAELAGLVEVDVPQGVRIEATVEVHQDADTPGHVTGDLDLLGAQERDVSDPERSRCCGRELRVQIGRGREDNADEVIDDDPVAIEHLGQ
jgi:hypothetical protein